MDYKKEAEKLKDKYANAECGDMGWCDTKKCPLWGDRKGRMDGTCVAETYLWLDEWVDEYERDIEHLQMDIDELKGKIRKLRSFKKRFEEYLEEKQ